jgi:hypothetical protein
VLNQTHLVGVSRDGLTTLPAEFFLEENALRSATILEQFFWLLPPRICASLSMMFPPSFCAE